MKKRPAFRAGVQLRNAKSRAAKDLRDSEELLDRDDADVYGGRFASGIPSKKKDEEEDVPPPQEKFLPSDLTTNIEAPLLETLPKQKVSTTLASYSLLLTMYGALGEIS